MVRKRILLPERVRQVKGGFGFIPHRFLSDGFWSSLSKTELLLYVFLVLVSDRYGLSYYSSKSICRLLDLAEEEYVCAREQLIDKDLVCFDGTLFQVLSLPDKPVAGAPQCS